MQRLYRHPDWLLVNHLRNLLETQGLRLWLRGGLMGGAGDLPITDVWPELWVLDDQDLERARALLAAALTDTDRRAEATWQCPFCHETLEPQFDRCWRCGSPRGATQ